MINGENIDYQSKIIELAEEIEFLRDYSSVDIEFKKEEKNKYAEEEEKER